MGTEEIGRQPIFSIKILFFPILVIKTSIPLYVIFTGLIDIDFGPDSADLLLIAVDVGIRLCPPLYWVILLGAIFD